jgi:hypothetical protein
MLTCGAGKFFPMSSHLLETRKGGKELYGSLLSMNLAEMKPKVGEAQAKTRRK